MEATPAEPRDSSQPKKNKKFIPPVAKPGLVPGSLKPMQTSSSATNTDKKPLKPETSASNAAQNPSSTSLAQPKAPPSSTAAGSHRSGPPTSTHPATTASTTAGATKPARVKPKPEKMKRDDPKYNQTAKTASDKPKKTGKSRKTGGKKSIKAEEEAASDEDDDDDEEEDDGDDEPEEEAVDESQDEGMDENGTRKSGRGSPSSKAVYRAPIGLFSKRTRESLIAKYNISEVVNSESKDNSKTGAIESEQDGGKASAKAKKPSSILALSGFNLENKSIQVRLAKSLKLQIEETEMLKFDILIVDGDKPVRTKKVLFALVRNVPIVGTGYLFICSEYGKVTDPLPHQVPAFAKIGSRPKYDQLFGKLTIYVDIVHFDAGFDYSSIYGLLKMCKANLIQDQKQADVVVSNKSIPRPRASGNPSHEEVRKVHQTWVFDCIEKGELQDNTKYLF